MKPILKYPGAKWRIAKWILAHMPQHEGYVEPFFGSGAVFFNKRPSRIETINDIDGEVVNFFRVCRARPNELADTIALTPYAREEKDSSVNAVCNDELESARLFAIRCWMTIGGAFATDSGWRHHTGSIPKPMSLLDVFLKNGSAKYQKTDNELTYAEFYDSEGNMIASYDRGKWTELRTPDEAARQIEFCGIYNQAWGDAKRAATNPPPDDGGASSFDQLA